MDFALGADLDEAMKLEQPGFRFIDGIPVFGPEVDEGALAQMRNCMIDAEAGVLTGDHHLGYTHPIGGVVAYVGKISPSGVGYDQGCGNKAVLTDMPGKELRKGIESYMDVIWKNLAFGVGKKVHRQVDHQLFDDDPAWQIPVVAEMKKDARAQLSSLGGGNHFCSLLVDEMDRVWIGVHFGSRGLGYKLAKYYLKQGGANEKDKFSHPILLEENSALGSEYIAGMNLALRYAYAGRDAVCSQVAQMLGVKIVDEIHNNHNFAQKETVNGKQAWVVRKGATPAYPGQKGFVGGSMTDPSVIIEGVDSPLSKLSLYSAVHGAGRQHSRTWATGKLDWKTKKPKSAGHVTREQMMAKVHQANVTLRGAGVDESPFVYKDLQSVLRCHAGTIKVLHRLTPVGVAMAAGDDHDPYGD